MILIYLVHLFHSRLPFSSGVEPWMGVLDSVVPTVFLTFYCFLRCLKPSLVTHVSPCPPILGGVGVGEGNL
eukprot:1898828-Prorocentrum_lima.AAC.1